VEKILIDHYSYLSPGFEEERSGKVALKFLMYSLWYQKWRMVKIYEPDDIPRNQFDLGHNGQELIFQLCDGQRIFTNNV